MGETTPSTQPHWRAHFAPGFLPILILIIVVFGIFVLHDVHGISIGATDALPSPPAGI
jgi:hypothetical protein